MMKILCGMRLWYRRSIGIYWSSSFSSFFFYRLRRKSCVSSFVFIVGIENGEVKFLIRWVTRWFLEGFLKRLILFFNIVSCVCGKYSKRSKKFWLFVVYDYGDDKNYAIKLRTLLLLYPFIKILLNSFNTMILRASSEFSRACHNKFR